MAGASGETERRLVVATVLGPQGVRGEVRLKVFADDPAGLARLPMLRLGEAGRELRVRHVGPAKGAEIYRIEGIDDRSAAEALKGETLTVARDALPEPEADSFYLADLVGMRVRAPDGASIGKVAGIANHGAGDVVELVLDAPLPAFGRHLLLPFDKDFVPEIRLAAGEIIVDIESWLGLQREDGGA